MHVKGKHNILRTGNVSEYFKESMIRKVGAKKKEESMKQWLDNNVFIINCVKTNFITFLINKGGQPNVEKIEIHNV